MAEYAVNKTKEIIGEDNITEYIEPSAGSGVFLDYLPKRTLAYDIEPDNNRILKQDYLTLDLKYKQGRCIIGNPPYGDNKNCIFEKFYKKSIYLGDFISFILPISQFNNDIKLYEFDLIYSEDLGIKIYSDIKLNCCFNIYKKNINGFNKKPNYNLKSIHIKRHDRNSKEVYKENFNYDIRICGRGNAVGKECEYENQYAKEYCIKINNSLLKENILNLIRNTNWKILIPNISTPYIPQYQILKYIKEQIPEIE